MKVLIVGAGVAGLTIGWRLQQAGVEVLVLERAQPGQGASWAAAGMLSASGESRAVCEAERTLSEFSAAAWPRFAAELEETSGRELDYRRDGKLVAFLSEEDRQHASADFGPGVDLLSASDARMMEPMLAPELLGAVFDPGEAQVDNRVLGLALRDAYLRAGGQLSINEAVVRFEVAERRLLGLRTPFAVHEADAFILAAGAWSARIDGLPPQAVPPVVPVKGEMIAISEAPLRRIVWGSGVYLVPRRDRVLVGATAVQAGFDTALTEEARSWLLAQATRLIPSLADRDIAEHWAGLRPGTPDDLPILGSSHIERLYIASGQFRNGILFAPAVGEILAALVLGRTPPVAIDRFDPRRFSGTQLARADAVR